MSVLAFAHGRAIEDFQQGARLKDAPYPVGSPEHAAWASEMKKCIRDGKVVNICEIGMTELIPLAQ